MKLFDLFVVEYVWFVVVFGVCFIVGCFVYGVEIEWDECVGVIEYMLCVDVICEVVVLCGC